MGGTLTPRTSITPRLIAGSLGAGAAAVLDTDSFIAGIGKVILDAESRAGFGTSWNDVPAGVVEMVSKGTSRVGDRGIRGTRGGARKRARRSLPVGDGGVVWNERGRGRCRRNRNGRM